MREQLGFTLLIGLLWQAPLLAVQRDEMPANPVQEARAISLARTPWCPDRQFTIPTMTRYAQSWRFI
jgi:hypothetical protein